MSWWYVGATVAAGAIGEHSRRKGKYGEADERNRAARESLLTAKYNIKQRTIEGRQTQFQVLETGGNVAQQIAIKGLQAEGEAEVAGASSGATIDSGTPRAALASIVQQALAEQTNVIIDTKNRIKAIARDTTNINTSEWRNAKLNQKQQARTADRIRKAADSEYLAGMINTGVKSYGAYKTASAWNKKSPSTPSTASKITTASSVGSSTFRGLDKGPDRSKIGSTAKHGTYRKGVARPNYRESRSKAIHTGASGLPSKQGVGSLKRFFSNPYATGKWSGGKHGWKIKSSGLPWWHGRTMK